MNPFTEEGKKPFFGRRLIEHWINPRREKPKTWQYSKMKMKQIAKRRKRKKIAYKSKRINRLRMQ